MSSPLNVILCPASNARALTHYEMSVKTPVRCGSDERASLGAPSYPEIRVWGGRSKVQWSKAKAGDLLLFVKSGVAFACAGCLSTADNPEMAAHAWQAPEWRYLFYVDAPQAVSIPVAEINAALGYKPNYKIRQLVVLTDSQSRPLAHLLERAARIEDR
jgi:hypothetical protein